MSKGEPFIVYLHRALHKRRNGDGRHCIDCPTGTAIRAGRCRECIRARDREAKRREREKRKEPQR